MNIKKYLINEASFIKRDHPDYQIECDVYLDGIIKEADEMMDRGHPDIARKMLEDHFFHPKYERRVGWYK